MKFLSTTLIKPNTKAQIFTQSGITVPITLEDIILSRISDLENIIFNVNQSILNNVSTVRFQYTDLTGVVSQACISTFRDTGFGQTLINQNCSSSSSGIIFQTDVINNTFDVSIVASITSNGIEYKLEEFRHAGTGSLSSALENNNLHIMIPTIFLFIGIATGIFFGNIYIGLSLIILLEWVAVLITPSIITAQIAVAITVICLLIFWGTNKK